MTHLDSIDLLHPLELPIQNKVLAILHFDNPVHRDTHLLDLALQHVVIPLDTIGLMGAFVDHSPDGFEVHIGSLFEWGQQFDDHVFNVLSLEIVKLGFVVCVGNGFNLFDTTLHCLGK